jgi:hypothetical protein
MAWVEPYEPVLIYPDSCIQVDVYLIAFDPQHNDSASVTVQLVLQPNPDIIIGEATLAYCIDDHAAEPVSDLAGRALVVPPDNLDGVPWVELTWTQPSRDSIGDTERIRWCYIYSGDEPGLKASDLNDSVAVDADPDKEGFQWYDNTPLRPGETRYYSMTTVDGPFSESEPSNEVAVTPSCCGVYTNGYTGNTNYDDQGKRNLADITVLIDHVYLTQAPLPCHEEGDTNGDGKPNHNLADITRLIDHVYISQDETEPCP